MLSTKLASIEFCDEDQLPRALHHALMTERPLLDRETEYELARMVRDYLDTCDQRLYDEAMRKDDKADSGERLRLYNEWVSSGNTELYAAYRWAREELWMSNTRFVMDISKDISRVEGIEFDFCMSYGMEGLAKAIDRYQPDKKVGIKNTTCRFTTYAHAWIRQSIQRGVADNEKAIRVPMHAVQKRQQIAVQKEKKEEAGERWDDRDIAKAVGLSFPVYRSLSQADTLSLNRPNTDANNQGYDGEFGDSIPVPDQDSVEDLVEREDKIRSIRSLIESYTDDPDWQRGAYIVIRRYRIGEDGEVELRTLETIGKELGLTRERVRQVEAQFKKHLRENHPHLQEWL
jgi:RNA polymerase primary sigma factor